MARLRGRTRKLAARLVVAARAAAEVVAWVVALVVMVAARPGSSTPRKRSALAEDQRCPLGGIAATVRQREIAEVTIVNERNNRSRI